MHICRDQYDIIIYSQRKVNALPVGNFEVYEIEKEAN